MRIIANILMLNCGSSSIVIGSFLSAARRSIGAGILVVRATVAAAKRGRADIVIVEIIAITVSRRCRMTGNSANVGRAFSLCRGFTDTRIIFIGGSLYALGRGCSLFIGAVIVATAITSSEARIAFTGSIVAVSALCRGCSNIIGSCLLYTSDAADEL